MINTKSLDANIALHTIIIRISQITIYVLMSNRVDNMCLDLNYFDAHIIQIIFTSEVNVTNTSFLYGNQSKIATILIK